MSMNTSGFDRKVEVVPVQIVVSDTNPLIKLARNLPWERLLDIILPDLKASTPKGCWWAGRPLLVRVHLAIFILQKIYDLRDREVIARLATDAAFQIFAGITTVEAWRIPVFQKVQEFRNRLSAETHVALSNEIAKHAVDLGLADPAQVDLDSTVQEANMSYSNDGSLLQKLGRKIQKVFQWRERQAEGTMPKFIRESLHKLGKLAKGYFFASRKSDQKIHGLAKLHDLVSGMTKVALTVFEALQPEDIEAMPWNIRYHLEHVLNHASKYLTDVTHYIKTGTLKAGKILAFHLMDVAYINKGKNGKPPQFGREFQVARIHGNFVVSFIQKGLRAGDCSAFWYQQVVFHELFGELPSESIAADRAYNSPTNRKVTEHIEDRHLGYSIKGQSEEDFHRLHARRAGIEPIIGHIKQGGQLGRSRMKSDAATHKAGFGAMLGFNLRQLCSKL